MLTKLFFFFNQPEDSERYWFAFILYSVKRLSEGTTENVPQGSDENGFNLCQILRISKLKYVAFERRYFCVLISSLFHLYENV